MNTSLVMDAGSDEQRPSVTAALLTPEGRGAVATVRVRGDEGTLADLLAGLFTAANGRPLQAQGLGRIVFGRWGSGVAEDVVLCRIDEQTVEIHTHGGRAAPRHVLQDLQHRGVTLVSSVEMQNQSCGRFQQELLAAVRSARTLRTVDLLLEQANGLLEGAIRDLLDALRAGSTTVVERFDALLRFAECGRHLTEPWRVVLTGRPNVGKSSLINALVGFSRSIVFDQPGTTRDVVTAEAAFDGWPFELIDTAGIRESEETLEATGIERARAALQSADCLVLLLDVSEPLTADDHDLLRRVDDPIVVAHKCDLRPAWEPEDVAKQCGLYFLNVSSKTGDGLDELQRKIVERLIPEIPPAGVPIPVTASQINLLREARAAIERKDFTCASQVLTGLLDQ